MYNVFTGCANHWMTIRSQEKERRFHAGSLIAITEYVVLYDVIGINRSLAKHARVEFLAIHDIRNSRDKIVKTVPVRYIIMLAGEQATVTKHHVTVQPDQEISR